MNVRKPATDIVFNSIAALVTAGNAIADELGDSEASEDMGCEGQTLL